MSRSVTRMEYPNQMTSTKFSMDPSEEFVFIGKLLLVLSIG